MRDQLDLLNRLQAWFPRSSRVHLPGRGHGHVLGSAVVERGPLVYVRWDRERLIDDGIYRPRIEALTPAQLRSQA
ncbi:hypothetical protein [Nonomuraea endophytica]|uniref:hypothetical protein n=1 Tax=Nonomuraea endophytica TaxID=714136 RepID=UPI0037C923D4